MKLATRMVASESSSAARDGTGTRRRPEGGRGAFSLKVGLDTPDGGHEHIWIDNLHHEGGELVGNVRDRYGALPRWALHRYRRCLGWT